jgi:cardiolipin synthase
MEWWHYLILGLIWLIQILLSIRVLLRHHRQPTSRIAWITAINAFPVVGIIGYFMLGEVNLGRWRKQQALQARNYLLQKTQHFPVELPTVLPSDYHSLFKLGQRISHFPAVLPNKAHLTQNSPDFIQHLVHDIDHAQKHIHILFYIWLTDYSGTQIAEALQRAVKRGVICRVLVDRFGSRALLKSNLWKAMQQSGIQAVIALPVKSLLLSPFTGRADLRNHRKIVVIDNSITYCGSQNCADPEFRVKPKYAPWVDIMLRLEGSIVRQNQLLFMSDWMAHTGEDITALLTEVCAPVHTDSVLIAQTVATGPLSSSPTMPALFSHLIHQARHKLSITTPYYVPDYTIHSALCVAAERGVEVIMILPARNDSWIVSAASRSYYASLLKAGVKLYEYQAGLLHAKTLVLDDTISLIGSANLDQRSFDLNYENNILFYGKQLATQIKQRQTEYLTQCQLINLEDVENWSTTRKIWNNTIAMLGPVL